MARAMEKIENPGRDRILGRIRSALQTPAVLRPSAPHGEIFAPFADPLERFQRECSINLTECFVTPDYFAASAKISEILLTIPPGEIFLQDAPWLRRMAATWAARPDLRWSSEGPAAEATRATVTMAELLVAATGSVVVSASCGGRGASIAAPVHIVVAQIAQLAPTLADGLEWMDARGIVKRNSMVTLITGPSRTGDIEKIIVMGAHGPQRLIVVLAMRDE
jgi:L-lactate dehydrogenase complex protein LldG